MLSQPLCLIAMKDCRPLLLCMLWKVIVAGTENELKMKDRMEEVLGDADSKVLCRVAPGSFSNAKLILYSTGIDAAGEGQSLMDRAEPLLKV